MKAKETNLLKFLNGPKQFIIPVYQRKYSWKRSQCEQLWKDIMRVGSDDKNKGHFIGSVVYIEKGIYNVTAVPELLVIDGQQRLTTLSLIINALSEVLEEKDLDIGINSKRLRNYYLFNSDEDGELFYKLILTKSDKETLKKILKGVDLGESPSPRVLNNYKFFYERLSKDDCDLQSLYKGLQKLIIVDIALDRSHDNPQLIFESLNSTGLDLSQSDLIRNFVLMGEDPQEQKMLYEDYWHPMEQRFGNNNSSLFDSFMRDYLTLKTGDIPKVSEVYDDFKKFTRTKGADFTIENLLDEINTYAGYYVKFALLKESDEDILAVFEDIKTLKVDVSYPLILELYIDYINNVLKKGEFIKILRLIESYVFRRAICGIPTNSLNKTFQTFSRDIDKSDYLDSTKAAFIEKSTYRRFPTNSEMEQELQVKDVYNFRSRNYLLDKLENYGRKEKVKVDEYTIEHIMPQNENLSDEWKLALGENWDLIHEKYLHTIGNLTLTGYNPELSDRPFIEKRDIEGGFKDSPIRLNRGLADLSEWDEDRITERSVDLADKITSIWEYPKLPKEKLAKFREEIEEDTKKEYGLQDHIYLQGEPLLIFDQLRKRILNLDSSVQEVILKLYIAYKSSTNFVDIIAQRSGLKLSLNMSYEEIDDPQKLCKDVSDLGRWGNGDVEFKLNSTDDIEYAMYLIRQSFEVHSLE